MTKIVIPEDITIFHSEAKRLREERDSLREENDKIREVNAEQAERITELRITNEVLRDQIRQAQQRERARQEIDLRYSSEIYGRTARSGE